MPAPRKLYLGPFQPALETALAESIRAAQAGNSLTPVTVIVPTRLLGLHLQRTLPFPHANIRFQTLSDISNLQSQLASPLALELLCRQLAQKCDGYFAPVKDAPGFASALLATFTDIKEAGLTKLPAKPAKLRELATAYAAFCQSGLTTEADLLQSQLSTLNPQLFFYGFYDLNTVQRAFVERLAPVAVFFPWTKHATPYAQPLLDWFRSLGYTDAPSQISNFQYQISVLSCPGEAAEVREAVRAIFNYLRANPGKTFADCAILCRSRDQYDAILRDTLLSLGVRAFFRGGRPLSEHPDARLLTLLLEAIRSDFSRAAVMELACHVGPHSRWDALSVELGIIGGQDQWLSRLKQDPQRGAALAGFVGDLFEATKSFPRQGSWQSFTQATVAALERLGSRHEPVLLAVRGLEELDAVQTTVSFETFAEFCQKALDGGREQPEKFQGGGLFVGDVMGARGLSFDFVVVLGLVEKSFPRLVREDPLLLDDERIPVGLPLKRRGYDEERVLFDLAGGMAREKLVLSFPRLEAATARPRVPSFLLLEATGAKDFKTLEKLPEFHRVSLSALAGGEPPVDERELDLAALNALEDGDSYLEAISPLVLAGVRAERDRWQERALTRHDGLIESKDALALVRDRFDLGKLIISATSLEDFFGCPFYYFNKHILHLEPWEEPEAAVMIDAADLGSLYHAILEDFYRKGGDLADVIDEHLRRFEREGVTGYPTVWEIKKEIIRQELTAFVAREQRRFAEGWTPVGFEKEFNGVAVAPPVRLCGKIDRIDRSKDGKRALVLDYKTGKLPGGLKNDSLAAGEALQLPLYLLAAEQLLPDAMVEAAAYLYFTLRGGYREISFSREALVSQCAELTKMLETAAGMIREGRFAQYATAEGCRRCDFRPICGNGILKLYARKAEDERMKDFRAVKGGES